MYKSTYTYNILAVTKESKCFCHIRKITWKQEGKHKNGKRNHNEECM